MDRKTQLEKLADPQIRFVPKLKLTVQLDLDYWDSRNDPPNLPREVLLKVLQQMPGNVVVNYKERESVSGPHCDTGDDSVFVVKFAIRVMGKIKMYYLKGYFFDKDHCRGVVIQSFKEEKSLVLVRK